MRLVCSLILAVVTLSLPNKVLAQDSPKLTRADEVSITHFLQNYCVECHGSEVQEANRRFDDLTESVDDQRVFERYQEILRQLTLGSMPPLDARQPSKEARGEIVDHLRTILSIANQRLNRGANHSVLRRLNKWEYRQTIGDLLNLNVETWDPTAKFPAEVKVGGFDNNGGELVTSGMLLDHYFNAAAEAIQKATNLGPQPTPIKMSQTSPFYFSGKDADDLPKLFRVDRFRFIPDTPYTDLYGRHYRGGHIGFLPSYLDGGVKAAGIYTVRVRAAAIDRTHNYGKAVDDFRNGDPLVMEIAGVDRRGSVESSGNVSKMVSLARVEIKHTEPKWYEWQVYLDAGFEPEVRFRNGPLAAKRLVRMLSTHAADKPEIAPYADLKAGLEKAHAILKAYQGPRLRVWEIQLEGPHQNDWPGEGHRILYGNLTPEELNERNIESQIRTFAAKAYRRSPLDDEINPIVELVHAQLRSGTPPLDALQLGLQSVLCSPGFLYLNLGEGTLSELALASRLSFFLWSSAPDRELLTLAEDGKLRANLGQQVERLLKDRRSIRFIQHFINTWLDLDNIKVMPPSDEFVNYYRDRLGPAMQHEVETFFGHVLRENLPPTELIDADYSFLNRELAEHYGVSNVDGSELRKVSLSRNGRGGLLGQGAFLTASANGVDTSPVVRGIYILEKLLGYTPPPPPPNIPAIEPDIRGVTSIREQLIKHRQDKSCASCHRKIDPLGFALEQFDAVGQWRSSYNNKLPIDISGVFPQGDAFTDINQFRAAMSQRGDLFTTSLAQKLLTYGLGRELQVSDEQHVEQLVQQLTANGGGLSDLIISLVNSEPFQRN